MFHRFHNLGYRSGWQGALSREDLVRLIQAVGPERIISPNEWLDRLEDDALAPSHVCLTFDDGLRCQFDVALDVLDEYNLGAFWFPYTRVWHNDPPAAEILSYLATYGVPIEDLMCRVIESVGGRATAALESREFQSYLNRMQAESPFYSRMDCMYRFVRDKVLSPDEYSTAVRQEVVCQGLDFDRLAGEIWLGPQDFLSLDLNLHEVGLHSHTHPANMGEKSLDWQLADYDTNRQAIVEVLAIAPRSAAYPLGSFSSDTLVALRHLGIACAFRAESVPDRPSSPLSLPRVDAVEFL